MKYWVLLIVGITFSLFSGCQTGAYQNSSGPQKIASSPRKAIKTINAEGDWLVLFHCQGNDYLLDAKIATDPGTIRLLLSGQGQAMEMPVTGGRRGAVKTVPQVLSGQLDSEAGSFAAAEPTGVGGTRLVGVFESSERFAAILQGRDWNGGSMLIGVRKGQKDEIEKLLAQPDSKLGQLAARSSLGAMIGVFKRKFQDTGCSKDETAWAKRIQQAIDETQGHGGDSDHVKLTTAMFSDKYFRPIFGESLQDIGLEEGRKIAYKLSSTGGCGQLNTGMRFSQYVLNDITMVLGNQLVLTRNYVMINNAAGRVIENWMANSESRIATITQTYSEQPETGIKKIDSLASTAESMNQYIWSPQVRSYRDQFAAARILLTKKEFFIAFSRLFENELNTFEDLNRLALFPSNHEDSYRLLTKQEKAEVTARIQNRMDSGDPDIVAAAQAFAARQSTISDISTSLGPLQAGKFSKLSQYTSAQHLKAVQDIFDTRKAQILGQIVSGDRTEMNKILAGSGVAETKLRNLVLLRGAFSSSNNSVINEPVIQEHTNELQQHCIHLLLSLEPQITSQIKTVRFPAQIDDLLADLIAREDQNTPVAKRIHQAQQTRVGELMEFRPVSDASQLSIGSFTTKGLNLSTELTAIYLGDFAHARISPQSALASAIFTKYLYAYGRHCDAYLPGNKVPITETKCSREWVETNGLGDEKRSCTEWVEVPTGLFADPRLYAAQKHQANKAGIDFLKNMLSNSDPFSGRPIADDVLSIGNDMDNLVMHNKCGNAGLKRFESNLYNFVQGERPLLLPGKETLSSVHSTRNVNLNAEVIDFKTLIDDLISENAKGWMMNRYLGGSVSRISIDSKYRDGTPALVRASYAYSTVNSRYQGDVVLKFGEGRPACLYFSDAPQTCRHPSRRIINKYEKGGYQK